MSQELPFEYHLLDQREAETIGSSFEVVSGILEQRISNEFGVELNV